MKGVIKIAALLTAVLMLSCTGREDGKGNGPYHYVEPSIDYRGRFHKGHIRKNISTDPNGIRNRTRSKYYYHTRGKYLRRSKSR